MKEVVEFAKHGLTAVAATAPQGDAGEVADVWPTVLALRNCAHLYPGIKTETLKAAELLRELSAALTQREQAAQAEIAALDALAEKRREARERPRAGITT